MARTAIDWILSFIGAAVGAAVGLAVFHFFYKSGFYAMVIPGASLGFGCLLLSRTRSTIRGVIMGILAVALGLRTEWRYFHDLIPFTDFRTWISPFGPVEYLMIGFGGLLAFWSSRDSSPWLRNHKIPAIPSK